MQRTSITSALRRTAASVERWLSQREPQPGEPGPQPGEPIAAPPVPEPAKKTPAAEHAEPPPPPFGSVDSLTLLMGRIEQRTRRGEPNAVAGSEISAGDAVTIEVDPSGRFVVRRVESATFGPVSHRVPQTPIMSHRASPEAKTVFHVPELGRTGGRHVLQVKGATPPVPPVDGSLWMVHPLAGTDIPEGVVFRFETHPNGIKMQSVNRRNKLDFAKGWEPSQNIWRCVGQGSDTPHWNVGGLWVSVGENPAKAAGAIKVGTVYKVVETRAEPGATEPLVAELMEMANVSSPSLTVAFTDLTEGILFRFVGSTPVAETVKTSGDLEPGKGVLQKLGDVLEPGPRAPCGSVWRETCHGQDGPLYLYDGSPTLVPLTKGPRPIEVGAGWCPRDALWQCIGFQRDTGAPTATVTQPWRGFFISDEATSAGVEIAAGHALYAEGREAFSVVGAYALPPRLAREPILVQAIGAGPAIGERVRVRWAGLPPKGLGETGHVYPAVPFLAPTPPQYAESSSDLEGGKALLKDLAADAASEPVPICKGRSVAGKTPPFDILRARFALELSALTGKGAIFATDAEVALFIAQTGRQADLLQAQQEVKANAEADDGSRAPASPVGPPGMQNGGSISLDIAKTMTLAGIPAAPASPAPARPAPPLAAPASPAPAGKWIQDPGRFLDDTGLLVELNRIVLHPLGLMLVFDPAPTGAAKGRVIGLRDHRADPDGLAFDEGTLQAAAERFAAYKAEHGGILETRRARLGYTVQSAPHAKHPELVLTSADVLARIGSVAANALSVEIYGRAPLGDSGREYLRAVGGEAQAYVLGMLEKKGYIAALTPTAVLALRAAELDTTLALLMMRHPRALSPDFGGIDAGGLLLAKVRAMLAQFAP